MHSGNSIVGIVWIVGEMVFTGMGEMVCLPKNVHQVTRTRVLTVLARLIQLEIFGLSE